MLVYVWHAAMLVLMEMKCVLQDAVYTDVGFETISELFMVSDIILRLCDIILRLSVGQICSWESTFVTWPTQERYVDRDAQSLGFKAFANLVKTFLLFSIVHRIYKPPGHYQCVRCT